MNLPITLTLAYLAINLAMMLWLERERSSGREPSRGVSALSIALRYGPPLIGVVYLELIAGDWLFLVFVVAFFALAFWLLDGLLALNIPRRDPGAVRRLMEERGFRGTSDTERDRS